MELFFEIHKDIPREGPGLNASTKQALTMLGDLPEDAAILDIGCGPGMQTLELARNIDSGKIVAMDTHKPFLDVLTANAAKEGLTSLIEAKEGSMFDLPFEKSSLDLIWSEGAIFIMGFEKGIQAWQQYLKTNGYLVVSEISWLQTNIPDEAREFWESDYPAIKGIGDNLKIIEASGYAPVGHFILPEEGWWQDYYNPLLKRIEGLKIEYADNQEALDRMAGTVKEIDLYRKYANYYGYVFYLMKKI